MTFDYSMTINNQANSVGYASEPESNYQPDECCECGRWLVGRDYRYDDKLYCSGCLNDVFDEIFREDFDAEEKAMMLGLEIERI